MKKKKKNNNNNNNNNKRIYEKNKNKIRNKKNITFFDEGKTVYSQN